MKTLSYAIKLPAILLLALAPLMLYGQSTNVLTLPKIEADSISQVSAFVEKAPAILDSLSRFERLKFRYTLLKNTVTDLEKEVIAAKASAAKHKANADVFAEKLSRTLKVYETIDRRLFRNRFALFTLGAATITASYLSIKAKQPEIAGVCIAGGVGATIVLIRF